MTPELALLLACSRLQIRDDEQDAIRQMLQAGIDWTAFARKAVDHGLACLAGKNLAHIAPDLIPDDILDALLVNLDQTRRKNRALFAEFTRILDALADNGIEVIPLKGPTLAIEAYGDLGLRVFRDIDFLVRDGDLKPTTTTLCDLGYGRGQLLTERQIAVIQRLHGQDFLFSNRAGLIVEPHTRLTPIKMSLDIDYAGLWSRAQEMKLDGRNFLMLAPEDTLLVLAIHGGKEMWWNIKWACDVAAFIESHPGLDWPAIMERARAQGCLRMLLLATALAQKYFNSVVPDIIFDAQHADQMIEAMVGRIVAQWELDQPVGPPSNKTLSLDRLRLHQGITRRARYVARTLLLPGDHHVASMRLPGALTFVYVPFKLVHDFVALPLWRVWLWVAQAPLLGDALARHDLLNAFAPVSSKKRQFYWRWRTLRASACRDLAADPRNTGAWQKLGGAMLGLKRYKRAIACYDKAVAIAPDDRAIWRRRAAAMQTAGMKLAFPDFARNPKGSAAWATRAGGLSFLQRFAEAVEASDRALALDPGNSAVARIGTHSRLHCCDWRRREDDIQRNLLVSSDHLALSESEAENRIAAQVVAQSIRSFEKPLWRGQDYRHDRIRIAYVSADLHTHATTFLMAGVFENHDRAQFQTTAISMGPNDASEMRRRLESAFDRFIDVQSMTDAEVAKLLLSMEIDIAVDLKGYTGSNRVEILARRPAPIQVNYLGFPGTMAVPFMDYILADRTVIPEQNRIHYSENVVYLPHSYQPNDSKRPIPESSPSRVAEGLPETGLVFACFNNNYKIGPEIFDVWMRLLHRIENSVLWLLADNAGATTNLRREAKSRGIAPERLVFARRKPAPEHLSRQTLADLFLDTLPYNAHTTASDALWAGLPVLTCAGNTFPSRVAASLLNAIGLPELVTTSLDEYEALALALARDPERLAAIKAKLLRNRHTEPLFDTVRFTHDLESAYLTMWKRQQSGLPPASFAVVPDTIFDAQHADQPIEAIVGRIAAQWELDQPVGPPSNKTLSLDRLRLHQGITRRARYVARTLLLPGDHHIASMPLPGVLTFVYVPFKLVHDFVALPLWRVWLWVTQAPLLGDALARQDLWNPLAPVSSKKRQFYRRWRTLRASACRDVAAEPRDPAAWQRLGEAMLGLKRYKRAIACYDRAVAIAPDDRAIWRKRAAAMRTTQIKFELPDFARNPKDSVAWATRAGGFSFLGRFAEAVEASDRALALDPGNSAVARIGIHSRLHCCDWRRREDDIQRDLLVSTDYPAVCESEAENRIAAQHMAQSISSFETPLWRGEHYRHHRVRLAYVSADMHTHAIPFLMAGVFETHNRAQFETTAISLRENDGSGMRRRLESAFDRFVDAQFMTDAEVAKLLRSMEIDIAVDLNGYTVSNRVEILARRPAPIQVNYLGFPGTMAVPFMDYILADRTVIPEQNRIHYDEKVVYLPHSYQPNDSKRPIPESLPDRVAEGLPETAFVFACFNNNYKIGPEVFNVWMRLLHAVENSVLWLLADNAGAPINLRREAKSRGIAPERLIFARLKPPLEHLSRQTLADLFLDTLPYNAHTTASDALWMGLPVLTCTGNTFPSRVAASLLSAIGLPELVTTSLDEYEALALALARDPERLAAIKAKLLRNRHTEPLFDTVRFTHDLESAYLTMWKRQQSGLPPASFAVVPDRELA